jgi:uncharacterized protein with WD repeat
VIDEIGIHFVDVASGKERLLIVHPNISTIEYSPRDTYLVTCEKYVQGDNNLLIWNSLTGKEVAGFPFKKGSKEGPKSIKFTQDDKYCALLSSKTSIDIYDLANNTAFEKPKFHLQANS